MNPQNESDREQDLQRREKELQEKEYAIRLRELEAEIYTKEVPYYETQKAEPKEGALKRKFNKLVTWAKFTGFAIVGFAVVYVGLQIGLILTYTLIATIVGFVGYKLFLEQDRSK
jgi:hypothetical protein